MIIMVFFFILQAKTEEKQIGTIAYAYSLTLKSALINLLYLALAFSLGFIYKDAVLTSLMGIWPLYMMLITKDSLSNPDRP